MSGERWRLHRTSVRGLLRALGRPHCCQLGQPTRAARLVARLAARPGAVVPLADLITAIWGDDPEGGPDYAPNCIRVMVLRLRRRGYPIVAARGRGYSLGIWSGDTAPPAAAVELGGKQAVSPSPRLAASSLAVSPPRRTAPFRRIRGRRRPPPRDDRSAEIDAWIRQHGVTRCPPMPAANAALGWQPEFRLALVGAIEE